MNYLSFKVPTLKDLLIYKRNLNLMRTNNKLTKLISYNLTLVSCLRVSKLLISINF
jgi:hypothetical protein